MWQLWCIATWGHPTPSQSSSTLTETPVPSLKLAETYLNVFILLIPYFTLWPWFSIFDLEHFLCIACDVMKLCTKFEQNQGPKSYKIWAKSDNFGLSYWQLSQVFQAAGFQTLLFRKGQPKCAEFEQNRAASSLHQTRNFGTDWLLCFEMRAAPRRVFRRSRPNFTLSDPR